MLAKNIEEKTQVYASWSCPLAVDIRYVVQYLLWLKTQPGQTTRHNAVRHAGCRTCPHGVLVHRTSRMTGRARCMTPGCLCMDLESIVR
jgi:hypothetical protein